ncbi:MAG: ribonuclease HI family protein [Candidatus Pacebacteria bacterium]|nr:ribonuclease HI family protein [Candidatus Paceibacterota bacterium]
MKLITFTDGGSRNNPGPAACGIVIQDENEKNIFTGSKFLGIATNNQAEYGALVMALEKAKELVGGKSGELKCYLDSELVVKQLNREYKVKDEKMKGLFAEVTKLCLDFDKVEFIHIRREKNKLADKLVNEELDRQGF